MPLIWGGTYRGIVVGDQVSEVVLSLDMEAADRLTLTTSPPTSI